MVQRLLQDSVRTMAAAFGNSAKHLDPMFHCESVIKDFRDLGRSSGSRKLQKAVGCKVNKSLTVRKPVHISFKSKGSLRKNLLAVWKIVIKSFFQNLSADKWCDTDLRLKCKSGFVFGNLKHGIEYIGKLSGAKAVARKSCEHSSR